jgi:hypothetical protein
MTMCKYYIILNFWYKIWVGLQSQMIHSQFRLVPGGSLELIRRCSSVTCHGHCVCSSQDGRCALITEVSSIMFFFDVFVLYFEILSINDNV